MLSTMSSTEMDISFKLLCIKDMVLSMRYITDEGLNTLARDGSELSGAID